MNLPRISLHPLSLAILLLLPGMASAQTTQTPNSSAHDQEHNHGRAKTLDELIITASPLQPGSEEVIQPIDVIAGEELDAKKSSTIGATVAQQPGVQSSFFGAGVGRPIIRGQEGARVQVLENGTSSLDVSTVSADHAVSIEPFLADQIEILKGPATLLYGSGAIGGAVNVVDGRIPEAILEATLSGRAEWRGATGANERTGLLRLDGGRREFAWHVDAFHRNSDDYEIPGFAESESAHESEASEERGIFGLLSNSALRTRGGAIGASWIGEQGFWGGALSTYRTRYGIPGHAHAHESEHEAETDAEHEDEEAMVRVDLEQLRYDLRSAWEQPVVGVESLRVRLGHNDYEHVELEGDEVGTRFENHATDGRIEVVHPTLLGWRGAYGLQFGRRDFEAIGEEAFVPPSQSRDFGLFLVEQREFERWTLEFGARHDQIEIDPQQAVARDFSAQSLSLGALWRINDAWHLSLGIDHAERAPNAEELYSNGPHIATQSFERGNAALGIETANQIELGAHVHLGPLTAKLALFRNRFDDFIYLADAGGFEDELPLRTWTQDDATFRGFEAEAELRLADNASGLWELRLFGDKVRASLDTGGALPRIAPPRFGAELNWKRDGWHASVSATRYSNQDEIAAFEHPSPRYTLIGSHLAYHWDSAHAGWEVFLDGSNLNNREARVHTSFLKDIAPLPGRSFALGVRAFF